MEYKNEVSTSLLLLNEYCLLDIFDFLDLDNSINLALSCRRIRSVAQRIFKKNSKFQLDTRIVNRGERYIEKLFSCIGQHVSSLTLHWDGDYLNLNKLLGKIINDCNNVNCLSITNCREQKCQNVPTAYGFDNVELLTLFECNFYFTKSFLDNFHKLKSLNISRCSIESNLLKTIIQNNPSIQSLVYSNLSIDFPYQPFQLITNVERLDLAAYDSGNISKLNSLLNLNRLTKLRLNCRRANINNFLKKLANKGIMEELELTYVQTDELFFDILTSFDKLELLVIKTNFPFSILPLISWPKEIKRLRFECFKLTYNSFIAMIQQLKSIENIDIHECYIAEDDEIYFKDVTKLSQEILHIIHNSNHKQQLDVVLSRYLEPAGIHRAKKYLIDSERLRILYAPSPSDINPLGIKIHFPGN